MFCHVATNVLRCLRVVLVVLPRGIERFLKVLQTESSGLQFFRFLMWVVKSKGAEIHRFLDINSGTRRRCATEGAVPRGCVARRVPVPHA